MKQKSGAWMAAGLLLGMALGGTGVSAAEQWRKAVPSWQPIFVDGERVQMEGYNIGGNNYVKLRDMGRELGFNVYWDNGVQVESGRAYTGEAPAPSVTNPWMVPSLSDAEVLDIRLEIVEGINALRREVGAGELKVNEALMDAAQICAEKRWSGHHNREECEIVTRCGYPHGFGCNLTNFTEGYASKIAGEAVQNWAESPGHYETAIDPSCDTIGVGVLHTPGRTYCIMLVGDPNSYQPYG